LFCQGNDPGMRSLNRYFSADTVRIGVRLRFSGREQAAGPGPVLSMPDIWFNGYQR